jgi:putative transposase
MATGKRKTRENILNTTIKIRLYPTSEQAEQLEKTFGCCRYIWNQMLHDQEEFYAATGVHFIPTPAKYKREAPFLKEADSSALANVHQNLRQAFQRFFDKPEHYHHPVYKRKKRCKDAYTVYRSTQFPNIYLTENAVRLPKIGLVRAKVHRKPLHWWDLRSVTVSKSPSGKYFCSLLYAFPEKIRENVQPEPEKVLGLNYSVAHFYVDSNGNAADPPHWLGQSLGKLAKLQKKLSKMQRNSRNFQQTLQKIRLLHEHIANQRKDFAHQQSRRIANAYDAVCVRDADLVSMSRTLDFGNVMDSGFGKFRECLSYKLSRQGKPLLVVDRFSPTARTCHTCGFVRKELSLKERTWMCPSCGTQIYREKNAAQNIRDWGIEQLKRRSAAEPA